MERQIMWSPWKGPGLEHLRLLQQENGIVADGFVLSVQEQGPFRVRYEIHCTAQSRRGRYRFESLEHGVPSFTADLPVDREGLVLDYPGLFRRVGAW